MGGFVEVLCFIGIKLQKLCISNGLSGFAYFDAFFFLLLQRESAMQRRITILQNTQRSMSQICRQLSSCKALNPRVTCVRLLLGCTITGTSPMMELSIWGLTSIFHLKSCLPPWRNLPNLLADHLVAHRVTAHGNIRHLVYLVSWIMLLSSFYFCLYVDMFIHITIVFNIFNCLNF